MESQETTRLSRTYCAARDCTVPILLKEGPAPSAPSSEAEESTAELLSCLDYGARCTGWLCPLFSVPTLPPEELLEEAIETERERKHRDIAAGKAILERAVREGREQREEAARREATRREDARRARGLEDAPPGPPPPPAP